MRHFLATQKVRFFLGRWGYGHIDLTHEKHGDIILAELKCPKAAAMRIRDAHIRAIKDKRQIKSLGLPDQQSADQKLIFDIKNILHYLRLRSEDVSVAELIRYLAVEARNSRAFAQESP